MPSIHPSIIIHPSIPPFLYPSLLPEQLQCCWDGAAAKPSPQLKLLPITIQIKHFHNHNQQLPAVCGVTKKLSQINFMGRKVKMCVRGFVWGQLFFFFFWLADVCPCGNQDVIRWNPLGLCCAGQEPDSMILGSSLQLRMFCDPVKPDTHQTRGIKSLLHETHNKI